MKQEILSPEQAELRHKQELLNQQKAVLTELELELTTLQATLARFESEYYIKVGAKYVELDRLQAELDRILASKHPQDDDAIRQATESTERAEKSAREAEEFQDRTVQKGGKFEATPELKATYRDLAKQFHPDLTLDPVEKERRNDLMQEINAAYESGDVNRLNQILETERNNPESIKGDDIGSSLVRTIRMLAQVEKRVAEIRAEIEELRKTDLYALYTKVNAKRTTGNDPLEPLANDLEARIALLEDQIRQMNKLST